MVSSAPCSTATASFPGVLAAAMTRAPMALPISAAVSPTPPVIGLPSETRSSG
jgi:hypothetical protein